MASLRCIVSVAGAPQSRLQPRARAAVSSSSLRLQPRLQAARTPVLPLLADLLESQALTAAFERLAGRAACVGVAAAFACELALVDPGTAGGVGLVFGSADLAGQLAPLGTFLLCCSVALAARTAGSPRARARLLEPVLASLTAQRRSLSGVSGRDVDTALDCTVDAVFTPRFLREHILKDDEADKYI